MVINLDATTIDVDVVTANIVDFKSIILFLQKEKLIPKVEYMLVLEMKKCLN
jgi:hypothetical protein